MSVLRVLHLVGSAQDTFYSELSCLYARGCLSAIADLTRYESHIAYITPDRSWRFPKSLSVEDSLMARPLSLAEAIAEMQAKQIDVVIPQMFCLPGMTQYRTLFDLLKIPYVGNSGPVMAVAAHKPQAKAIVAAAGVKVPQGECLRRGEAPTLSPPVVIKPSSADNSLGVTLVQTWADYPAAMEKAFHHAPEILVEAYIELGREVRCGLLERDGKLIGLPLQEYPLDAAEHPIRSYSDKLKRTDRGDLTLTAKGPQKSWIVDPGDPITEGVQAAAKRCHQALGCRHYSLFDFRIDAQGHPWFLEAGLYCSFSPNSVISEMAKVAGLSVEAVFRIATSAALPACEEISG